MGSALSVFVLGSLDGLASSLDSLFNLWVPLNVPYLILREDSLPAGCNYSLFK